MITDCALVYVEDDPMSREGLDILLRRVLGIADVWIFENSANFMERVKDLPRKPDLFLLDIHMQPHSGFEMLQMLRSDAAYHDAWALALTASVMNEEIELLRKSGFNGMIAKPVDVRFFPSLIEQALKHEEVWHISSG